MPNRTLSIVLALVSAAAAVGWSALDAALLPPLGPGWSWDAVYIGTYTPADEAGKMSDPDSPVLYNRTMKVMDGAAVPSSEARVRNQYFLVDVESRQKVYEYIVEYRVDPRTGEHLDPRFAGQHWVFPRFAEKKSYTLRTDYLEGVPLAFEREDVLNGLPVYLYGYRGRGEYTASYRGTTDYPGVDIPAGQEVRCADDQFQYRAWVEPVSGGIVKVEESCRSGDYLYDSGTERSHAAISRWDSAMAGDHVARMVERFRWEKIQILAVIRGIPAVLAALALVFLISSLRRRTA